MDTIRGGVDLAAPPQPAPLSQRTAAERLNFLLTNRLPRRWLTLFMGRFSRIRQPLVRKLSMAVWQFFVDDLRLYEAEKPSFDSVHDCFVRRLAPGARPIAADPDVIVSPCDAVVGEFGVVRRQQVIQAKGFPYSLPELLGDATLAAELEGARFVTLRLKSSMYHHFHAPCDARLRDVRHIAGDTWNVNPVALKTVERLFCRNERAVLRLEPDRAEQPLVMVPVAAILVASLRIEGLEAPLGLRYEGPEVTALDRRVSRGERLGNFEHGSTIILFAAGETRFAETVATGSTLRMGQPLLTFNGTYRGKT